MQNGLTSKENFFTNVPHLHTSSVDCIHWSVDLEWLNWGCEAWMTILSVKVECFLSCCTSTLNHCEYIITLTMMLFIECPLKPGLEYYCFMHTSEVDYIHWSVDLDWLNWKCEVWMIMLSSEAGCLRAAAHARWTTRSIPRRRRWCYPQNGTGISLLTARRPRSPNLIWLVYGQNATCKLEKIRWFMTTQLWLDESIAVCVYL